MRPPRGEGEAGSHQCGGLCEERLRNDSVWEMGAREAMKGGKGDLLGVLVFAADLTSSGMVALSVL